MLDGVVESAPAINEAIDGGTRPDHRWHRQRFTQTDTDSLAQILNFGSLPISLKLQTVEQRLADPGLRPAARRPDRRRASAWPWSSSTRCSTTAASAWSPSPRCCVSAADRPTPRSTVLGHADRLPAVPRRHRRLHRGGGHHRGLVRRLLRTTTRRGPRGPYPAQRCRAGLGPGPAHDHLGRHRVAARRRDPLLAQRRQRHAASPSPSACRRSPTCSWSSSSPSR